jgi:hypothetical protein
MILTPALRSMRGTDPIEVMASAVSGKIEGSCVGDENDKSTESKPTDNVACSYALKAAYCRPWFWGFRHVSSASSVRNGMLDSSAGSMTYAWPLGRWKYQEQNT